MKRFLSRAMAVIIGGSLLLSNMSPLVTNVFGQGKEEQKAKYVFYFIGDGFGIAHKQAAEYYLQQKNEEVNKLIFSEFPVVGLTSTYAADSIVTDSAAAGTALATGYKTNMGMISTSPEGAPLETLVEKAEKMGKATGIVSTTRITHATPATFAAHGADRGSENEIAVDYLDSGVDYFAGGGARHFVSGEKEIIDVLGKNIKTKRTDSRDMVEELEKLGYKTFIGQEGADVFKDYTTEKSEKVFATFAASHMPYTVEANQKENYIPTLADMVNKGIDILEEDKEGFVMVVEGGRIDHAAHAHDYASVIQDTLAFNDAIKEAYAFYLENPEDTLIVVTSDHETGGFGLAGQLTFNVQLPMLDGVKVSVEDTLQGTYTGDRAAYYTYIGENLGLTQLTEEEKAKIEKAMDMVDQKVSFAPYGEYNPVAIETTDILNERAGVGFITYSHTAAAVPVYAVGNGSELFAGCQDNTDIPKHIEKIMGYSQEKK